MSFENWPEEFSPDRPPGGNAPGHPLDKIGHIDIGCVGSIVFNNMHCIFCPEQEKCIHAASVEDKVYKPRYYRTRDDLEIPLRRKKRRRKK